MSNRDVVHKWQPSERLRKLAGRVGFVASSQLAFAWVWGHEGLFSSKHMCSRTATAVRAYVVGDLRMKVAESRIVGGRVVGGKCAHNGLGSRVFKELQSALARAH